MSLADDSSKNSSLVGIDGLGLGDPSWSGAEDDDDFEGVKTDQEVGKYSFLERLEHLLDILFGTVTILGNVTGTSLSTYLPKDNKDI
jgi:hypothetical protein